MRSVAVTLGIVEAVARSGPIGVSDLARQLALPKSTAQRALLAAADAGWLVAGAAEPTRWTLAPRLLTLFPAGVAPDLREAARAHLCGLRDATGDAVHLVVRDGTDVVLLERLTGTHPVQVVVPVGFRVPLHAGASGKAILAAMPTGQSPIAATAALARLTELTVTSHEALADELADIRAVGYATNAGEWDTSVVAVAAAIVTADGVVHGAVSVSSTPARLGAERRRALGPIVASTARRIATALDGLAQNSAAAT
jgi:IclR family acetate operon transcriptional repressor